MELRPLGCSSSMGKKISGDLSEKGTKIERKDASKDDRLGIKMRN
jgi:hypothetical protein